MAAIERPYTPRRAAYDAYMRSALWRARKTRILQRAGYLCERCGSNWATQVHHLTYERFGDEDDADLQAICRPCHRAAHGLPADG